MSEDSVIMEKKNFTPPSKKLDSSRNRQDGSGPYVDKLRSKPTQLQHFDGANVPCSSKSEPAYRGGNTSKGKTFDKKARPREPAAYHNHPPRGPEVGSLQAPGGKKQSTHNLLQFVLAPRERNQQFGHHYAGGGVRHNHLNYRSKHNKDQYLNGRCQFMMVEGGDSSESDPDRLVDWSKVEQVIVRAIDEYPKCPICLEIPRAAKITKCGHIYCSTCLLHYFALSDGTFKSCPICYESIQVKEVKSVLVKVCNDAKVGKQVEMKLMFHEKNSLLVKQVVDGEKLDSSDSKIIVIPKEEVEDIIGRELLELRKQYEDESETPEVCFVEEAIRNAFSRQSDCQLANVVKDDEVKGDGSTLPSTKGFANMYLDGETLQNADFKQPRETKASDRERKESEGSHSSDKLDGEERGHYFYQATDGQNIFLHPINVAMIKKQFGSDPSNWPSFVNCVILEIEDGNITEEKRKRHKFLSHLSLASAVKIVEVDVKGLVSEAVCKEFGGQLEYRGKRRLEKEMSEKQREKLYEEQEKKKTRLPPKPKIESQLDFPNCSINRASNGANLLVPLLTTERHDGDHGGSINEFPVPTTSASVTGPQFLTSSPDSPKRTSFSFAQAASSPRIGTGLTSFSSRIHQDSKRMTMVKSPYSLNQTPEKGDDEYAAPEYSVVISQEMAKAFANLDLDKDKPCVDAVEGSKKKGWKKGKVLFATGFGGFGGK